MGIFNRYQEWNSPYYKDTHRKFRAAIREFVAREIEPNAHEWDENKAIPRELYKKCFQAGSRRLSLNCSMCCANVAFVMLSLRLAAWCHR